MKGSYNPKDEDIASVRNPISNQKDGFEFVHCKEESAAEDLLYKLRINFDPEQLYAENNRRMVVEVICMLNEKYSHDHDQNALLKQFKSFVYSPDDVKNSYHFKLIQMLRWVEESLLDNISKNTALKNIQKLAATLHPEDAKKALEECNAFTKRSQLFLLQAKIINEQVDLEGDFRVSKQAQFTLYPAEDKANNIRLLLFIRDLEVALLGAGFSSNVQMAETDSRLGDFVSFRQQRLSRGSKYLGYDASKVELEKLKHLQSESKEYHFLIQNRKYPKWYDQAMQKNDVASLIELLNLENTKNQQERRELDKLTQQLLKDKDVTQFLRKLDKVALELADKGQGCTPQLLDLIFYVNKRFAKERAKIVENDTRVTVEEPQNRHLSHPKR